jgi:hypothetical protein
MDLVFIRIVTFINISVEFVIIICNLHFFVTITFHSGQLFVSKKGSVRETSSLANRIESHFNRNMKSRQWSSAIPRFCDLFKFFTSSLIWNRR